MKVISGAQFEMMRNRDGCVADCCFDRCTFSHCYPAAEEDPAKRFEIRRVQLRDCRALDCGIQRAAFEDVVVDGLQVGGDDLIIIWGCLFKHVVFRGRIDAININRGYKTRQPAKFMSAEIQQRFDEADKRYYQDVDWALDIRDARLTSLRVMGIPVDLIRRDPASQAIVRRRHVVEKKWASIDLSASWWPSILGAASRQPGDDLILVAPKLDDTFEAQVEGIRRLREAGIADPD